MRANPDRRSVVIVERFIIKKFHHNRDFKDKKSIKKKKKNLKILFFLKMSNRCGSTCVRAYGTLRPCIY